MSANAALRRDLQDEEASRDYQRIEQALAYVAEHRSRQPELAEVAARLGMSEFHFQRLFSRWVGISPKRFLQHLTLQAAKRSLEDSRSVFDAALDAGLSGAGRLHDLFVTYEAVTPGEYKHRGEGLEIAWGFHPTPFGEALLLVTGRGLCGLEFVAPGGREAALDGARRRWPAARLAQDPRATGACVERVFSLARGMAPAGGQPLRLFLCGTRFQIKVWEALLRIPPGRLVSYQQLARHLGYSGTGPALRAVGTANGENAIPWLIPCHRVLRKDGALGGYRYGPARKLAMIGWEAAAREGSPTAMAPPA